MQITNGQRALWMVLITSLAAPLFASLAVIAAALIAPVLGADLPGVGTAANLGEVGVASYIWSALPATVAAIGLSPYVIQSGSYSWLHAAVAGVLAFTVATVIWPIAAGDALALLAFLAGLVAMAMRSVLIRVGILTAS